MSFDPALPVAVVTGASAGVGKAAAAQLLTLGWQVIGVGRDPARSKAAADELASGSGGRRFIMLQADLASLAQTAQLADQIIALAPRLDVLLNNAGGVCAERVITAEGHEATFAGNHLGPFLLTRKLTPLLQRTAARQGAGKVRIAAVSSTGHEHCPAIKWDDLTFAEGFVGGAAYCHAKLCNVLIARELARRLGPDGIISHAMHPGVVDSNFASHCEPAMQAYMESIKDRSVTPDHAARTLVWLATADAPAQSNGGYFYDRGAVPASAAAMDDAAAARLWEVSEALIATAGFTL